MVIILSLVNKQRKKKNSVYVVTEVWNKWKYNLIRKQLIVLEKKETTIDVILRKGREMGWQGYKPK